MNSSTKGKILSLIVLFFCRCSLAYSQEFEIPKSVYNATHITFYGYDFTHFHLADSKRMGQGLKRYIFVLTDFLNKHLPESKYLAWTKVNAVTYNFTPTYVVNKKVENDDIGVPSKTLMTKDSLQSLVNRYQLTENSGVGQVIFFECFDNASKQVSAYSVFFDVSTKNILSVEYAKTVNRNSYNRISDWSAAAFTNLKELCNLYKDKRGLLTIGKN